MKNDYLYAFLEKASMLVWIMISFSVGWATAFILWEFTHG